MASAGGDAALAYPRRLEMTGRTRVGVVIQAMVDADVAGFLFDVNPVTGGDEIVSRGRVGAGRDNRGRAADPPICSA